MRLCCGAQAGSIARKSGDWAAVIDIVAMGLRQITAYIAPKCGRVDARCRWGMLEKGARARRDIGKATPMIAQTETAPIDKTEAAWDAKPRLSYAAA